MYDGMMFPIGITKGTAVGRPQGSPLHFVQCVGETLAVSLLSVPSGPIFFVIQTRRWGHLFVLVALREFARLRLASALRNRSLALAA